MNRYKKILINATVAIMALAIATGAFGIEANAAKATSTTKAETSGTKTTASTAKKTTKKKSTKKAAVATAPIWFDGEYYAYNNPDVAAVYGTSKVISKYGNLDNAMYAHYKACGEKEGRKPAASANWFDSEFYAKNNSDVVAAYGNSATALLTHYRNFGRLEGRLPSKGYVHTYGAGAKTTAKNATVNNGTNTVANKGTVNKSNVPSGNETITALKTPVKKGIPYYIMVNRAWNTVTVYGAGDDGYYSVPVKAMLCSTGREGHRTPRGNYAIYEHPKNGGFVTMVDGTYGKWCMRFRKGGLMFHTVCYASPKDANPIQAEVDLLGDFASLGCVRLSVTDAEWMFNNMPDGTPVTVYDGADAGPLGKPSK